jgi:hypothetical protein
MSDAYTRVYHRGVTLNKRTLAMLMVLEDHLGRPVTAIPQGSYHGGTSQSAGTHDGGGAIDIYDTNLDGVAKAGRRAGFAMWHRRALPGVWSAHCHGIAVGDAEMSAGARSQVNDYFDHKDGLASHAYDPFWRPDPLVIFNYNQQQGDDMQDADFTRIAKLIDARIDPLQERVNQIAKATQDRDASERQRQADTARAVLSALADAPNGVTRKELRDIVAHQLDLHTMGSVCPRTTRPGCTSWSAGPGGNGASR